MKDKGFTTAILHSDRQKYSGHGELHEPVYTSVAYGYQHAQDLAAVFQGHKQGFSYSRQGNPTVAALEKKISMMEGGLASVCFATGMGAISATMISLLNAGDHIVSSTFLFGNTNSFLQTMHSLGIEVTFVDATDLENVVSAIKSNTRMVYVETIANPCTQIADLQGIGEFCCKEKLLFVVDNTMTSPYLFKPHSVYAGLVINSMTKYIGGHGVALGGVVTVTGSYDWSNFDNILPCYQIGDPLLWGLLQIRKKGLRDAGATLAPEAAHHIALGMESLALRLERSCDNAMALAVFFDGHNQVNKVYYPGLSSHAQNQRASALFHHFGALMSIELDSAIDPFGFLDRLKVVVISSNLGDNRTLAIPVAQTIFFEMGADRRASMGITDGTIRLSIGIEDQEDLLEDFDQALK